MLYFSLVASLLLGSSAADAFVMSARQVASRSPCSPDKSGGLQRKDFLKQVVGATTAAVAGVASYPLASKAASSESSSACEGMQTGTIYLLRSLVG